MIKKYLEKLASKNNSWGGVFLRVAAALMVLICHVGQYCDINGTEVGSTGVLLFFILSGYWAYVSYSKKLEAKIYYISRIKRIIPIYWSALIVNYIGTVVLRIIVDGFSFRDIFIEGPCGVRYLRYFFFLHGVLPSDNYSYWNNAYGLWTMSSFALFYLLVPVLFKVIKNYWYSLISLIIFLLSTPFLEMILKNYLLNFYDDSKTVTWFSNQFPINTLYCFLFGVFIYFAIKEQKQGITFCILGLMYLLGNGVYSYEIMYACIVLGGLGFTINVNATVGKIFTALDIVSFPLYLIHPIALKYINGLLKDYLSGGYLFIIMVVICIFVAFLFERVINVWIPCYYKRLLQ